MLAYIMDGKSEKAWAGLGKRVESGSKLLKLTQGPGLAKSTLSNAVAGGMPGTHLGETEHNLGTHHLRLFHLLLPVRVTVT
jgi:hypothetical protein